MKLYHTSTLAIPRPDIRHSRDFLDFGKGFYLTSIQEQALRYGERFIRRKKAAWINIYELECEMAEWDVLRFDSYDKEWLNFVSKCRNGIDDTSHDMVIGGIADDRVVQTLDRFFEGELTEEQALGMLRFEHPNIQFCIRSQELLDRCLTHIESSQL